MKAIHKDREKRFADANEMLRELEKLEATGATTIQGTITPPPPVVKKPGAEIPSDIEGEKKPRNDSGQGIPTVLQKEDNEFRKASKYLIGGFIVLVLGILLTYGLTKGKKAETPDLIDTVMVEDASSSADTTLNSLPSEPPEGMVIVQGGTFTMGSTDGDLYEKPTHQVTVSSFLIGKYEVTKALWESVMGNNPSYFKGSDRPVEQVSWYDAVEFCNKLSEKEGLQKAYTGSGWNISCDFTANGYRLPTEAEWEYAARGGNQSKGYEYSGSNDLDAVGWFGANDEGGNRTSKEGTSIVGKKQSNELGIYDMSGNVWEWCWDWYSNSYYSSYGQIDPRGPNSGSHRVLRGGGLRGNEGDCRVADRGGNDPANRLDFNGFRLARTR
ncbi:MAG: formylglycine-generating enzyme family protein [Chlorobiota bacterium]|nr:MAG: formylglycine-generating enzyme family protein [Chlorobiota bacterium]